MNIDAITQSVPDAYALERLPEAVAIEHHWLPFCCDQVGQKIHIATQRVPTKTLQRLATEVVNSNSASCTHWTVQWCCINKLSSLTTVIRLAYADSYCLNELTQRFCQSTEGQDIQLDDEHWPMARWLDAMLNDAVHSRASDIHLLLDDDCVVIDYRVDGALQHRAQLPATFWRLLVARIKILAELDVAEHRRPQDGAFERTIRARQQPVRVALMPHASSEKLTLRLLMSPSSLPGLSEIFRLPHQCQQVLNFLRMRQGLIVVAGATGSGKTTTLYGCLLEWRSLGMNVISLEDPIEIKLPGVCQSAVNTQVGYEFADGLRAALRHDPDGLLVGEIRDEKTCALALRAAVTGHPVLASVHAQDAAGVFHRLRSLGASAMDLQETISLIIVQRLARTLCVCGGADGVCHRCMGSGYFGRVAIVELFRPAASYDNEQHTPVSYKQNLITNYTQTLAELMTMQVIDQAEHDRVLQSVGGTDAKISCSSG